MFTFDIDDEFESFMREVFPTEAEHSAEYKTCRRVFYAGCVAIFFNFFMSDELLALSPDERLKAFENVKAQMKELREREDFDI
jgi:hypothetical protein